MSHSRRETVSERQHLTWQAVTLTLTGLGVGTVLILTGHASPPEAAGYVWPVFTLVGLHARR
ncbi:hypothetical protein PV726_06350 [Streptomyces europaeiscabiei]|uniref:hypothetical protein n=1 Tax=Streptomyces europaeiscabiei TaxID=146819 RepID=UPI0029A707D2|nr:hypothetical protein [Streptomyces europaeiscabiei]MDX3689964.1 hypothetical protein [Streptomyces europaeiscabiei]